MKYKKLADIPQPIVDSVFIGSNDNNGDYKAELALTPYGIYINGELLHESYGWCLHYSKIKQAFDRALSTVNPESEGDL